LVVKWFWTTSETRLPRLGTIADGRPRLKNSTVASIRTI